MNKLQELELEEIEDIMQDAEDAEKFTDDKYKILNLDGANKTFRKLKAIAEKIKEIEDLAKKEIEPYELEISKINDWKKNEIKSFDRSINFFNFLLEQYYREQRELDPKFKLSTPNGKVTSRKQQPKWDYDDEKLLPYLENYSPELIRIKKEVNKIDFKDAVNKGIGFILLDDGKVAHAETGEVIEGITITEQGDSITIKVVE